MLRLSVIKSRFVFPDGVSLPPGWGWRPRCCGRWGRGCGCVPVRSLAQLVERPDEVGEVAGSSPAGSAGVRWWRLVPPVAVNYRAPFGGLAQQAGGNALKMRTGRVRIPHPPHHDHPFARCGVAEGDFLLTALGGAE